MNDMKHFSDNIFGFSVCRPFPPSEGGQKTRENAHLRKVGKVWWPGKCGERQFSWRSCICPPSEGVRKMRETAHLRKVEQKVGRKRWRQGRGLAVIVIVGALLLCIGYFQAGAVSVQALEKYGMRQSEVISGVVVEAGSGTPVAGAVVLYVPAGQEGAEYALSDVQGPVGRAGALRAAGKRDAGCRGFGKGVDAGLRYGDTGFSGWGRWRR